MSIRRPLSPGKGWDEVSLYSEYAELAQENLTAGCYFETITVCCVGFEVLVNSLPGRIRLYHFGYLTQEQQQVLEHIETSNKLTAGQVVGELSNAKIINERLALALDRFNVKRNNVIHPLEKQKKEHPDGRPPYTLCIKPEGVTINRATKETATKFFHHFCDIIDLSGGESPRKAEEISRSDSFSQALQQSEKRWS